MDKAIKTRQPIIHIEPAAGGVNLFVPIESEMLANHSYQEQLIRAQQMLFAYLAVLATEQLPVIA